MSVPVLTFLDAGTVTPVITDPDGDLTDVSIDYVDTDSGYRVWGYPVGSPTGHVQSSVPLRPGHYAVCVTEGPTTVCQDGSSTPRGRPRSRWSAAGRSRCRSPCPDPGGDRGS